MKKTKQPKRSADQTQVAISLSKTLFNAMEEARDALQMERSNFIRSCIAKELMSLGVKVEKG
jgi:metal-responsive CopG/Arc/MetJ family transcriptional regulator